MNCQKPNGELRVRLVVASVLFATAMVPTLRAANRTWSGALGTDFETPGNWSVLPANSPTTDIGVFSGTVTANQPQLSASRSITGLVFSTAAGGWTLGSNSASNVLSLGGSGIFTVGQTSGTDTISANLAMAAAQTWAAGTGAALWVAGSVTGTGGFSWSINDATNQGDVVLSPALGNSVNISGVNDAFSLVQVKSGGVLQLGGVGGQATTSVNTIKSTSSTGGYPTWGITGTGKVRVNSGTWNTGDLGKNGGDNFTGTLEVAGGTLSLTGARYLGSGMITVSGGALNVTNLGSTISNGGRFSLGAFNSGSGIGSLNLTAGTVDLAQANGGNSFGTGISTLVEQSGGTLQNGVTLAGGTNGGTVTTLTIGTSGLISTGSGTTLTFTAISNVLACYTLSGGTLTSAGAIQGTAPATAGTNGSAAIPPGAVIPPGTANIRNFNFKGGTLATGVFIATNLGYASATGVAGGVPHADPGANSVGIGTLYNNGGTLAPGGVGTAGRTAITGGYVINSGALAIDLGGTTQATAFQTGAYDYLTVTGATLLAGNLSVNVLPGFTPSGTTTFTILNSTGALTGAFTNVAFGSRVTSSNGLHSFVVSQVGNTVTLSQYLPVAVPTLTVVSGSATATPGDNVVLAVSANSLDPVTYQWFKNGTLLVGATTSSLTLPSVQNSDTATYSVTVTNAAGSTTQTFPLTVTTPPSTGSVVIPAGSSQAFNATPSATTFVWTLDGNTVGTNSAIFTYSPDVNAVGTHWLKVKETYADATSVTRQWSVRVSLVLPTSTVNYYVSPTGVDTNSGSIGSPFRTLEKARDTIRLLPRPLPAGGVTVYLRGGMYYRTSTFALTTSDSGTATAPIIYTSYPGETAIISGGKNVLSSQFAPLATSEVSRVTSGVDTTRIWEADMTVLGLTRKGPFPNIYNEWQIYNVYGVSNSAGTIELFYNGQRKPLARYPNNDLTTPKLTPNLKMNGVAAGADTAGTGYLNGPGNYTDSSGNVVAVGGAFQYNVADEPHIARWQTALSKGGVWVVGYWRVPWQINGAKVGIIDTGAKKVIGLVSGTGVSNGIGYKYSRPIGNKAEPWWVVNLLEELDQPGEWCMDFSRNKIYFLMDAPGAPPDNSVVLSDLTTALVQIAGNYVNFQGITFQNGLSQGVQVLGGSRNLVVDCTFRNMGGYAVDLNNLTGGTYNGVLSCDMQNMASGGVLARGGNNTASPRVPTNNFIVNNRIQDYSQVVRVYAAAIDVGFQYGKPAVGMRVAHNTTSGSPHGAILWKDYDHTIEYNDVSDYCQYSNDFGGIYTFAPNYVSGTTIRYNYLHDSDHGEGIYFDSDHINATTFGNTVSLKTLASESRGTGFYDQVTGTTLAAGVPYTDISYNNVAVNCRTGFQIYSDLGGKIENNLTFANYSTAYKWNRITVGTSSVSTSASNAATLGSGPNLSATPDPGFLDYNNDDFRFRPDATAFTAMPNFEATPLEMSGLYNDEYRSNEKIYTPFIVTNPASNIGGNTATFNGTLVYPQFERNATVLLYWGTTDGGNDPLVWQNATNLGTPGSGTIAKTLADLAPGTRYYYRLYAVNSAGEDWAELSNSFVTYPLSSVAIGGIASDSSSTTPAGSAFDTNNATSWQSATGQTAGTLQYEFAGGAAYRVTRYLVTSSGDSPAKDPRDWQFRGSFDGINWVTLDTRTGETFAARGLTRTFGFANNNSFRFYQLNITANNGDNTSVQLAELQLFAPLIVADTTGPVITTPDNLTVSGTSSGANVSFEVSAVDAVSGNVAATANPASGAFFAVGTTTVTVSATDAAGNLSTATFTVTVTAPTLAAPWTIRQIAPYAGVAAGTATAPTATSFTIVGGGGASTGGTTGDMWTGNNDSLTYLSQPWTGDGIFTARVASFSSTDSSAKAGIAFRETTNQGSRYSSTYMLRKGDAWAQHKTATSGSTTNTNFFTANSTGKGIPYWVRLVRTGNVFTNFISPDGITWTALGSTITNTLSGAALTVGFVVAPRTGNTVATVTFDNISFLAPLVAPTGVAAAPDNALVTLTWNPVPTVTTYSVKRSTLPGGPYTTVASGLTATSYSDNTVVNGTSYYYVATASNILGESPISTETSATPLSALQNWRNYYFNSIDNAGDSANTYDYDGDGYANLMEYALGSDPTSQGSVNVPTLGRAGNFATYTFNRAQTDVTYRVEASSELTSWTTLATNPGTVGGNVTVTDTVDLTGNPLRRFFRLRVISP